jgi:purine-binding chemotaxis protein CheW
MTSPRPAGHGPDHPGSGYLTVWIGGQLFGLPIPRVRDLFMPSAITPVPMGPRDVAGVVNLRGRIVTAISTRGRLGLPPPEADRPAMAVEIEAGGESYGLIIDAAGGVVSLDSSSGDDSPAIFDPRWAELACGVCWLEGQPMVVLDVDRVLALEPEARAARVLKSGEMGA